MSTLVEESALARAEAGLGVSAADPFFIVGVGRCGTSILAEVLRQHSRLHVIDESHLWPALGDGFQGELTVDEFIDALERVKLSAGAHPRGHLVRLFGMTADQVRSLVAVSDPAERLPLRRILDPLMASVAKQHGASQWGEKTPAHLQHVDAICDVYPGARFIHMVRDGRDVAVSMKRDNWGPTTLHDAAYKWHKSARLARDHAAKLGPERWLTVRYEDIVARPEDELRRVVAFLGVDFEPSMLSPASIDTRTAIGFSQAGRSRDNLSPSFLEWSSAPKQVFFSSSVGSWARLGKGEIEILEAVMAPELVASGYELSSSVADRTSCAARLAVTGVADLERRIQKRLQQQDARLDAFDRVVEGARKDAARIQESTATSVAALRAFEHTLAEVSAKLAGLGEEQAEQAILLERTRVGIQSELNRLERRHATAFESLEEALRGSGVTPSNSRRYGDL